MQVTNIHKNIMGTISFNAKFGGMRKEQDFIVYPITSDNPEIVIQSDNRIGYINSHGDVVVAKARNRFDFVLARTVKVIDKVENIEELLAAIRKTSSSMAGSNGIVYSDNSLAGSV